MQSFRKGKCEKSENSNHDPVSPQSNQQTYLLILQVLLYCSQQQEAQYGLDSTVKLLSVARLLLATTTASPMLAVLSLPDQVTCMQTLPKITVKLKLRCSKYKCNLIYMYQKEDNFSPCCFPPVLQISHRRQYQLVGWLFFFMMLLQKFFKLKSTKSLKTMYL